MSLHADLLDQAEQLAQLDPRRPKQANLRRAISSAYYALFHLLAWESSAIYTAEPGMAADQPDAQPRGHEESLLDDR